MLQTRKNLAFPSGIRCAYGLFVTISCIFYNPTDSGAVQLTNQNFDTYVAQHEVVFLNFYADWCRFSQILGPVFDEAADKLAAEVTTPGKVLLGKVDCDKDTALASRFHISKYPTLKLIRNSQVAKREFRGQRSADSLVEYIKQQIEDPVQEINSLDELDTVEAKHRLVIAFLESKDSPQYNTFRRVATNLKDDGKFYVGVGPAFQAQRQHGDTVIFRPPRSKTGVQDRVYPGDLLNFNDLNEWATSNCLPLVREITFENAEEFTEEGLPFLILFHHPDDTESVEKYNQEVMKQLLSEKATINFLTADGVKFAHPLHHLGKTMKDLPLIAIDSFRHMYLFPDAKEMSTPGKLKQFIDDLHSGKLHREFHYGPDPVQEEVISVEGQRRLEPKGPTTPPESTFRNLQPSRNRYTLLRDEL